MVRSIDRVVGYSFLLPLLSLLPLLPRLPLPSSFILYPSPSPLTPLPLLYSLFSPPINPNSKLQILNYKPNTTKALSFPFHPHHHYKLHKHKHSLMTPNPSLLSFPLSSLYTVVSQWELKWNTNIKIIYPQTKQLITSKTGLL